MRRSPFFTGFLEGYNTMDALAALAFGIVVVNVIKGLGVKEPGAIARNTAARRHLQLPADGLIYLAVTIVGTQSRALYEAGANGGEVLAIIAKHYFGTAGAIVSGRHRDLCLPENGDRPDHELRRDLSEDVQEWPELSRVGDTVLHRFAADRQHGPFGHHRLFRARC